MARHEFTGISADGDTSLGKFYNPRRDNPPRGTVYVFGTFGGGTVTLQSSPDGGTTFIDVPDSTGAATTLTANGMVNFELFSDAEEPIELNLNLAGATAPSLTYVLFDSK